jgi:hypothetical protein
LNRGVIEFTCRWTYRLRAIPGGGRTRYREHEEERPVDEESSLEREIRIAEKRAILLDRQTISLSMSGQGLRAKKI